MRIHAIKLTNFRQFIGEQTFELLSDNLKPVSLIFGANGAGKTTLLNAFTWALYGSMSDDVEKQDRMVTDIVWRSLPIGGSTALAVELTFDHEGHDYRLRRHAELRRAGDSVVLTDLGSTNGTRVNGAPIRERVLVSGDEVSVGSTRLIFEMT